LAIVRIEPPGHGEPAQPVRQQQLDPPVAFSGGTGQRGLPRPSVNTAPLPKRDNDPWGLSRK
jgi:hypothetical protein